MAFSVKLKNNVKELLNDVEKKVIEHKGTCGWNGYSNEDGYTGYLNVAVFFPIQNIILSAYLQWDSSNKKGWFRVETSTGTVIEGDCSYKDGSDKEMEITMSKGWNNISENMIKKEIEKHLGPDS
jgi:hypothetical protein